MKYFNEIVCGDNVQLIKELLDDCIDLTVTSPPYDGLRKYNGYSFDFNNIAKELFRVTKQGGVVVWVVGDSTTNGSESGTSFRQALFFKEIGFNLHDTMIYGKENWVPLTHNRYEQQFEYMFVFSKGKPKTFIPIKIPCIHKGRVSFGTFRHTGDKTGVAHSNKAVNETKIHPNIFFYQIGNGKSTKDKVAFKHPATFPEQLVEDHIITWSNEGDVVLDPFVGSGTVTKIAKKLNRNFIGIDVSEEYCNIARERLIINV